MLTAAVSLGVAIWSAVRAGWVPVADEALMEMRIREMPAHLPAVGVYSKFGWNHPGPAPFYLFAPFYWLGGGASSALLVGALVGHYLSLGLAWIVARRIDRIAGAGVLLAGSLLLLTTDASVLRTPWNPYAALLGGLLLVVLGWAAGERMATGLVLLAPSATVLVQTHIVTAPAAVAICVAAALATIARPCPGGASRWPPWRPIVVGSLIAAAMWVPPLLQQIFGEEGNISAILSRGAGSGDAVGLGDAVSMSSRYFAAFPAGMDRVLADADQVSTGAQVPLWLAMVVAAVWFAIRRRDHVMTRGLLVSSIGMLGAVLGVALITEGLFDYLVVILRPLSLATLAIAGATLCRSFDARARAGLVIALSTLATVVLGLVAVDQATGANPRDSYRHTVVALADAVRDEVPRGPVHLGSSSDFRAAEVQYGVMLQLERAGYDTTGPLPGGPAPPEPREPGETPVFQVIPLQDLDGLDETQWRVAYIYQPLEEPEAVALAELHDEMDSLMQQITEAHGARADALYREIKMLVAEIEELSDSRVPMALVVRR